MFIFKRKRKLSRVKHDKPTLSGNLLMGKPLSEILESMCSANKT